MTKKLPIVLVLIITLICSISCANKEKSDNTKEPSIEALKASHKKFLENSPFKNTQELTKKERANKGLPPKRYMERLWELTMNPALGHPTPENLATIQKELITQRKSDLAQGRIPGDDSNNNWVERGPNNVGGRTRAIIFDPNDSSNETVFAGGVSGGLWKNTNISNASSVWTSVNIPENLNISSIAVDPNNSKIMYVGTGESYVQGDVNGNGVWKSTDGGNSWTHVFGGAEGETVIQTAASVTVNSPSEIANRNVAETADFGPRNTVTGDLVMASDGSASPYEACGRITNNAEVKGKIALIYRGNCGFIDKVKYVQDAGAIGVVVINNEAGAPIGMGGTDTNNAITIPSVMISMSAGSDIRSAIDSGDTVNVKIRYSSFAGYYVLNGNQHINDVLVRDNNGVSEVYIAAGSTAYFDSSPFTLLGPDDFGLYKSVDAGSNWSAVSLPLSENGSRFEPNDIELGADNTVWVATRNSLYYSDGGGTILSSKEGNVFTVKHTLEGSRTQIATSPTNPNKIYVLAEGTEDPVIMQKTTDGFATITELPLPDDVDPNMSADDFCRNQAYYNLVIKTDPKNDETVFVGGIDLFKSENGGVVWNQLSHWYGYDDLANVHADQHAIVFGNNDSSKMVFGNDGGVYYSSASGENAEARNNGYNVTQFYTVAISPTSPFKSELILAGSQDNGNQLFQGVVSPGINSTTDITGGDGAATFFDQDGEDTYLITNYVYNALITKIDYRTGVRTTIFEDEEEASNGEFINIQALDSRLDYLFSNFSSGNNYSYIAFRTKVEEGETGFVVDTISNAAFLNASPTAMAVSPHETTGDHSTLYLGLENGKLLKVGNASTESSQTWEDISSPQFLGSISDIEFGGSSNTIFVTFHNYGVNNIWSTNDGGTTWKQKDGNLPDMPVKTILQNPLNLEEVVVGTELGVWYTANFSNDSPTWVSAFNGMSNVKVLDLDLREDNTIYAATYGRGVFSGKFTGESLSVEDNVLASGISLYPTVSNGEFKVNSKTNLGEVNLQIFNLSGQSVYVKNLNLSGNTATDITLNVASGMYLARFTEGATTTVKKFIIK
ncbi:glycoside hydrolase (GHnc) [Formosa agariphila KMM 3901]|uniref:Glycoside hydrolase (GHnc) n=1 Tax=Formosa agariphila (strain DSM 15362 / KCTC 12365 / LMG 23005 / KMM 3901 / M-2Alg 35-1) TaxID=1347342 RepID=T2KIS1_FORAG|nr:T9SS type A sorting domain-containing protein [Formosa agariphila]CDF77874.1 glycoside hydrolase (GHnc) [Formosa agariphila KMM 3901]